MILSPLDKEQVARRHTCKRAGRRRLKRAGGAGSKEADLCPRPMEGQVASRQTYAKGSWQGADLCPSYDRPLSFQTYAPPMSRPLPQGYAKGQVARSRPLPLLCPSYASFAFACNSKHAFFVFHICDAGGAPIICTSRQFILHQHIHHLSCHVSSYVSQDELCTSMRVPAHAGTRSKLLCTLYFVRACAYLRVCVFHTQKIPVAVFPAGIAGRNAGRNAIPVGIAGMRSFLGFLISCSRCPSLCLSAARSGRGVRGKGLETGSLGVSICTFVRVRQVN
jgi:hypothetical protein